MKNKWAVDVNTFTFTFTFKNEQSHCGKGGISI